MMMVAAQWAYYRTTISSPRPRKYKVVIDCFLSYQIFITSQNWIRNISCQLKLSLYTIFFEHVKIVVFVFQRCIIIIIFLKILIKSPA